MATDIVIQVYTGRDRDCLGEVVTMEMGALVIAYTVVWFLGAYLGYKWGEASGQSRGYLRGYRDGGKGKTFKRDKETY